MRNFIIALILFLGIVFVFTRISELQFILNTLQKGDWRFLVLAGVIQGLWLANLAKSYQVIFRAIGIDEKMRDLLPLTAAVSFTNIVAPTVGMSGIALLMARARSQGYSSARAAVVNTMVVLFDYLGFLLIMAVGLFVLFRRQNLGSAEIVATAILVGVACLLALLLYQGTQSTAALEKSLDVLARMVNRIVRPFGKPNYLSEERAHTFASEAYQGLSILHKEPKKILPPILLGLSSKILLLLNFLMMFLAFKVPIAPGTIVAGFSLSYLFYIVSPTPAGLGVVEGALPLALRSMYIPLGTAVVITLSYRAFTFWLPLVVGMVCFRWISGRKQKLPVVES